MINIKELIIRAYVAPGQSINGGKDGKSKATGNCAEVSNTEAKELMEEFQSMLQDGQTPGFKSSKR